MRKIFRVFTASLLTIVLSVATVVCCCSASAAMANFHKVNDCSHCPGKSAHSNSSDPVGTCQYQLTSAEFSHSPIVISSIVSAKIFPALIFLNNHQVTLTHSLLLAYPPGGPPLGISFTPLYLRTFNLRI
jgi:hypothetical protein